MDTLKKEGWLEEVSPLVGLPYTPNGQMVPQTNGEAEEREVEVEESPSETPTASEQPSTPKGPSPEELANGVLVQLNSVYDPSQKPESLKDAEATELTGVEGARQKVLDLLSSPSVESVSAAEKLVPAVGVALGEAVKAVKARLEGEARKIRTNPLINDGVEGADEAGGDLTDLKAKRLLVTGVLEPLTATSVETANGRLAAVESAFNAVKEVVRKRKEDAKNIRDLAHMKDGVDGADELGGDLTDLKGKRVLVTNALKEPLLASSIGTANTLLGAVEPAFNAVKEVVRKRKEDAKNIRDLTHMKDGVDGADEPGGDLTDLKAKRLLVTGVLEPLTATSVSTANSRLGAVESAFAAVKEVVRKRKEDAKNIRDLAHMKDGVDGADEAGGDLTDLKAKRLLVTGVLEPLTATSVSTANGRLAAVELAFTTAKGVVTTRAEEAAKLLAAVTTAPLKDDPAGAMKKQKERLKAERELAALKLGTKPLSATALAEGKAAKEKLEKLHKGVVDAVAKAGGDVALGTLVADVGEANIEALETAFGAEDPEKLGTLLADLGGKDSIKTLLAQYPTATDLKKVCDNLGGPKGAEAVMRVGCGGDAARMKKTLDAFGTTEAKDLQDLVEKGGLKPEVLGNVLKASFDATKEKARKSKATTTGTPLATVVLDLSEQNAADLETLTQIKSLVTTFKGEDDQKRLASVLDAGGLGANPATLGAVLQTGCGGDATKLKKFTDGYLVTDVGALADLKGVLSKDGLSEIPAVFGGLLAAGCDGDPAKMKTFCAAFKTPDDQKKLRDLARSGLGGGDGEAPERLGVVYKEGLANKPALLKQLQQGFAGGAPAGADLLKLKTTMDAFDAPPPPAPPPLIGKRLGRVSGHLKSPPADLNTLKTKYYDGLAKGPRGGVRAAQEAVAADAPTQAALTHSAKARQLATKHGAIVEVAAAATAAETATSAAAAAALAGAGLAPEFVQAAAAGAEAAGKAAELSVDRVAASKSAAAVHEQTAKTNGVVDVPVGNLKIETDKLAAAANLAAVKAKDAAVLATAKVLSVAPLPTPADIKDAADKAKDAAAKAALATDDKTIKETLEAATKAAQAAAAAAAKAAKEQAKTNRTAKAGAAARKTAAAGDAAAMRWAPDDADALAVAMTNAPAATVAIDLAATTATNDAAAAATAVGTAATNPDKVIAAVKAATAAVAAAQAVAQASYPPGTPGSALGPIKNFASQGKQAITQAPTTATLNVQLTKAVAAVKSAAKAVETAQPLLDPTNKSGTAASAPAAWNKANAISIPGQPPALVPVLLARAQSVADAAKDAVKAANALGKVADLSNNVDGFAQAVRLAAGLAQAVARAAANGPVTLLAKAAQADAAAASVPGAADPRVNLTKAVSALQNVARTVQTAQPILDAANVRGAAALALTALNNATAIAIPAVPPVLPLADVQALGLRVANAAKDAVAAASAVVAAAADMGAADETVDEAGQAALAAAVANTPAALAAMLKASSDEAAAVAAAADPNATPAQIKAARALADASAVAAAKESAVAATTEAGLLQAALPVPPTATADQIAGVTAAGTAAYAASLATTDTTAKTNASAAAVAAYDAAFAAGKAVVPAAGEGLPPQRWAAGAAQMQKCKITRGLFDSGTSPAPASMETLLRFAATLEKKHLVLDPTDLPDLGVGSGGPANETRMDHVCERHTRAYFSFDPDELAPKEELMEGLTTEGAADGLPLTPAQQKSIRKAGKAKRTSYFPEGTEKADVKKYIKDAVDALLAGGTALYPDDKKATTIIGKVVTFTNLDPTKQFGQYKGVAIASGLKFTIGLQNQPGGTHYKVSQFYPEPPDPSLVTYNPADMHAVKDSLGV